MVATQSQAEERMVLHDISWETYERLLRDHEYRSTPRFTYDRGELEIMSPLPGHDRYAHLMELLMLVIAEEVGKDIYALRTTTFRREDIQRGLEPDACYYLEHADAVRGKERLDLRVDPPPDLVIEIDVTRSTLDKLSIYHKLGVPEAWRFDGERLQFNVAVPGWDSYEERPRSPTFPIVDPSSLATLLQDSLALGDVAWTRRARAWVRDLLLSRGH